MGAIHKLLLRKAYQISCGHLICTFQCADCREGPARATLSLVLDGCNSTLLTPINSVSQDLIRAWSVETKMRSLFEDLLAPQTSVHCSKLERLQISESIC